MLTRYRFNTLRSISRTLSVLGLIVFVVVQTQTTYAIGSGTIDPSGSRDPASENDVTVMLHNDTGVQQNSLVVEVSGTGTTPELTCYGGTLVGTTKCKWNINFVVDATTTRYVHATYHTIGTVHWHIYSTDQGDGSGTPQNETNIDQSIGSAPDPVAVPPPTITGDAGINQNSLSINSGGGDITDWYVYRDGVKIGQTGGSSSYIDTTAVVGTEYTYTVRSVVGTQESVDSNAVLLTATAPSSPTGGTSDSDLTPRDMQLMAWLITGIVGYKIIHSMRYRGYD
jgi:hypothetical protein